MIYFKSTHDLVASKVIKIAPPKFQRACCLSQKKYVLILFFTDYFFSESERERERKSIFNTSDKKNSRKSKNKKRERKKIERNFPDDICVSAKREKNNIERDWRDG